MLAPFGLILGGSEDTLLEFLSIVTAGAQLFLPFLFPDGRFIPRSTRWRAILGGLLLLTPAIVYPVARQILSGYSPGEWAYAAFIFTAAVMMAAGLVSQLYRYRRVANALQRQQMKWVLVGFGVSFLWILWGVLWLTGILARLNVSEALIALVMIHLAILASAALPLTIGFSILRYRLWQVDLVINRALVFAGLTLLVTMLYVLVVGILGALFQAGSNLLLSILATGLIAILFHPLRQRLQQTANRFMYGERDDPATVLSRLGKRLEETSVPTDILPALVETIAQTLKLPYVAIKVDQTVVASAGEVGNPSLHNYPLTYHSQPIGQLLVAPRAPGESFSSAELRLFKNIARQAGAAVYAYRLTRQLQRSRQRLVTTREEERRRLRRDLHDGLGPRLATLTLKVEAARNYLQQEPQAADELLVELKGEIQEALQDVRRLAYALRPPALDQLGLAPALIEHASRSSINGLKVVVEVPENLPPLPAAVEVAAYRIALEAMTNVVRHAQATRCTVRLSLSDVLHLEIADDGLGLAAGSLPGVGLASMRERAAELGGSFALESTPEVGTRIAVSLPVEGNAS
jgi:signal transduction histidine kinase